MTWMNLVMMTIRVGRCAVLLCMCSRPLLHTIDGGVRHAQVYLSGLNATEASPAFLVMLNEFAGAFHVWLPFVTWTNTLLRLEMK